MGEWQGRAQGRIDSMEAISVTGQKSRQGRVQGQKRQRRVQGLGTGQSQALQKRTGQNSGRSDFREDALVGTNRQAEW